MLLFSRVIRLFSMLAMIFVLASCGGGGTGSPLDNNSGGGDPTDPTDDSSVLSGSVQMTMEDESNPGVEITSISSTTPGLLLITLLDDDGDPVANEIVQLEVVLGAGELSASTALTNASGVASINVNVATGDSPGAGGRVRAWYEANSGDTVEGFYNYEVVNSGTTSTAGFSVAIELYETGVDISSGTPVGVVTNTVSSANPGTLVIIVTDTITDNPNSNAIVDVATDVGVLVPDSGRVLTNANGIATVTVTSDDTAAAGAGTLVVTVDDVVATRNFSVGSVPLQLGRDNNGYTDVINNLDFVGGEITISNNNIAASGSTALRVVVADENGDAYTQPLTINFTSPCSIAGDANLDSGITTTGGIAVATYEATGCSGNDTVTAVIEGVSGASASGTVNVAASVANSIRFLSATPEFMSIKGTGTDSADLVFQVVDQVGTPQAGVDVSFELSTTLGGITLTGDVDGDGDREDDGVNDETASTNASGQVTVTVNSGTAATPVRVVASITVGGETITTVSEALTITTGLPDQDSFSLSASTLNPGGNDFDGIESILTIRAGDAFNNPVPDGTTINFITEYGRITNPDEDTPTAACQTTNGTCSVVWNSQDPRSAGYPASIGIPLRLDNANHLCTTTGVTGVPCTTALEDQLDPDFPGQIYGGRTTVLAYAVGEETFVDANGNGLYDYVDANSNGVYDSGTDTLESFTDLPEAFLDHNEDGVYGNEISAIGGCDNAAGGAFSTATQCAGWEEGGASEEHIDLIDNDVYDGDEGSPAGGDLVTRDGFGNGIYNGSLCSPELAALTPPRCTTTLVNVRDSLTLIAGGSTALVGFHDGSGTYLPGAAANVDLVGAPGDNVRQIYIADVFNGYLPAGTTITVAANNCKVFGITEYEIQDTNTFGIFTFSLGFAEDTTTDNSSDTIDIEITPPDNVGGGVINTSFLCSDAD